MEKLEEICETEVEAESENHSDDSTSRSTEVITSKPTYKVVSPPSYSSISQPSFRTVSPPSYSSISRPSFSGALRPPNISDNISQKAENDSSPNTEDSDSNMEDFSSQIAVDGSYQNTDDCISQNAEFGSYLNSEDERTLNTDEGSASSSYFGYHDYGAGGDYPRELIEKISTEDIFKLCEWGQFNKKRFHSLLHLLYRLMNRKLMNSNIKIVNNYRSLYVQQEEYVMVAKNDVSVNIIGTEFMTTCHTVIITHAPSGSSSLGHFSQPSDVAYNALLAMIEGVFSIDAYQYKGNYGVLEIQLYGGFKEKLSRQITYFICQSLRKIQIEYGWKMKFTNVLVSDMNNEVIDQLNQPIVRNIALDIDTGEVFKCKFMSRDPDEIIRAAKHYSTPHSDMMYNIYNSITGQISFGPHNWPSSDRLQDYIDVMSNHEDNLLRSLTSSSPEQEDDKYLDRWREVLQFINNYSHKDIFRFNQPRVYCRSEDKESWLLVPL